jgi:hypothetical protein
MDDAIDSSEPNAIGQPLINAVSSNLTKMAFVRPATATEGIHGDTSHGSGGVRLHMASPLR